MALKLKGSTSGFVGLDAPSVAGNNTLILPENSGSAFQLFANDITAGVTTFTTVTVNRNGDLTVPGTISIGGTLTYEDVTSVDSIGIVTARGLSIFGNTTGLNVASGISTFQAITGTTGTFSSDVKSTAGIVDIRSGSSINTNVTGASSSGTLHKNTNSGEFAVVSGGTGGDNHLSFYTSASAAPTEKLRITSGGKVNIGTGSLTQTDRMLNVYGGRMRIEGISSGNNFEIISNASAGQSSGILCQAGSNSSDINSTFRNTSGTTLFRIRGDGKVGIGTDTPHVTGLTISGASARFQLISPTTGGASNDGVIFGLNGDQDFFINNRETSKNLLFFTENAEKFRITSAGNVGVNQSNPDAYHSSGQNLVVGSGSGDEGITIASGTSSDGVINFADGTAGSQSYMGRILYRHDDNAMTFHTNTGAERLRINSSGKLFIAKTSGSAIVDINASNSTVRLTKENNSDYCGFQLDRDTSTAGGYFGIAGAAGHYADNAVQNDVVLRSQSNLLFAAGGNGEKMRIDSSTGAVGVNDSTNGWAERFQVTGSYNGQYGIAVKITQSSGSLMRFGTTSGVCGSITGNGTNSAYNTSSDYRLKENDVRITDGISRVKQLRPIKFNWKTDPSTTQDGFFAHEVSPVVPESVTGEKDASIDEIGAGYQMIDHSKLVPLLTAALQEAITEIETLKTKVAALEGS